MNDFEQRLRQLPLKPIPADWRAPILAAATTASDPRPVRGLQATSSWKWQRIQELFWPHPKAWAGLATVWLLILGLHISERDEPSARAEISTPPSPEMRAELRQQQQLLAELLGPPQITEADRARPKPPQPRTETARMSLV